MTDRWWVLNESDLLAMLMRVAEGEDPMHVCAEFYANAEVERRD